MRNSGSRQQLRHWVRLIAGLVLLGMAAYAVWQGQVDGPQADRPQANPPAVKLEPTDADQPEPQTKGRDLTRPDKAAPPAEPAASVVPAQTIYDLDGEVAFQGDVDLTATLARITAGEKLRFPNDGSTFQNRERRLPRKPPGYYKEYVHPTPGLPGPGPQRIVVGQSGERFYTPDHYESFRRLGD